MPPIRRRTTLERRADDPSSSPPLLLLLLLRSLVEASAHPFRNAATQYEHLLLVRKDCGDSSSGSGSGDDQAGAWKVRVVLSNRNYVVGRVMSSNVLDTVESGLCLCRVSGAIKHSIRDTRFKIVPYGRSNRFFIVSIEDE